MLVELTEIKTGTLADAMVGADLFIGVSVAGAVTKDMVKSMNDKPIILAMANPVPEIMPDEAREAGALSLNRSKRFSKSSQQRPAFPGIFRGAIDAGAKNNKKNENYCCLCTCRIC